MFGELVAFLRIANVPAQVLSDTSTVSFLVDELVPAGSLLWASAAGPGPLARPVGVISGDDGRQEGEEHDLDEHVLGVDSANFLWFAMGSKSVRMDRQDKERAVGLNGGDRRLFEAWARVDRLYNRRLRVRGGGWSQEPGRRRWCV